jgi:hypothetical protein
MWHGAFRRLSGSNPLTGPLSTTQREGCRRHEPLWQEREGFMTGSADSTPHPNAVAQVIVSLPESSPVADDRFLTANRASPRQTVQRDYPGSRLSFASDGAIKRITAGVKDCR